jgi:WD40 repeat protein
LSQSQIRAQIRALIRVQRLSCQDDMSRPSSVEAVTVVSLEEILLGLHSLGILTDAEREESGANTAANADPHAAKQFAARLVEEKRITPYQSSVLLAGRWRELSLGDYLLRDRLGKGGMGEVFLALHRHMQREVALKVLLERDVASEEVARRFRREIQAIAKLSHPNIVTAYDAGEDRGMLYLVMEYVEGETLHELVRRRGPLPETEAVGYLAQVARGLSAAHARGIIHRDVKPSNLLSDRQGTIKILDLGLACLANPSPDGICRQDPATLTRADQLLGTVDYMAPEQAGSSGRVDQRADIYSLGCCLYYFLRGRPVYPKSSLVDSLLAHREEPIPSLREGRPDVSPQLDAVFRRMVAKRPEDRFVSADEVLSALDPREGADAPESRDESMARFAPFVPAVNVPGVSARLGRKRRLAYAAGAGLAMVVGLCACLTWWIVGRQGSSEVTSPYIVAGPWVVASPEAVLEGHTNSVECLAFVPGRDEIVSGGDDQAIFLWNLKNPGPPFPLAKDEKAAPCLAVDPRGALLATCTDNNDQLKLWDLPARKEIAKLAGHRVAFSPTTPLLATALQDDSIALYDTVTRELVTKLAGHRSWVRALAFSPDGRTLASGDELGKLIFWDVASRRPQTTIDNPSPILSVVFVLAGRAVAAGSDDGVIRLWNIGTGDLKATLVAHRGPVRCVACSPDGAWLASAGGDGAVTLWDIAAGRHLLSWQAHASEGRVLNFEALTVAFSPNGARLASGGDGWLVKLWDLQSLLATHAKPVSR